MNSELDLVKNPFQLKVICHMNSESDFVMCLKLFHPEVSQKLEDVFIFVIN